MNRRLSGCMLAAAVLLGVSGLALAEEAKEVKLTGTLQCAKCEAKEADATKCQDELVVSADGKSTKYYLSGVEKANHQCHGKKDGVTVTGTLEEKDGKNLLAVTKIEIPAGEGKHEHKHE